MGTDPLLSEALSRFNELLELANRSDLPEPTACTLATAGKNGRPTARTVLLKGVDNDGFVFYTNTTSRKGNQLKDNPYASMCFFWPPLDQQVLVEGKVESVTAEEADAYWATRPRESQIGGWASLQSQILPNRETLMSRVADIEKKFANQNVPRPPHWSGYRIIPDRIEFWVRGDFRLHERQVYQNSKDSWVKSRLYP